MDVRDPGQHLLKLWGMLHRTGVGRRAFCLILFRLVPYSGSIGARVVALEPGSATVELRDRRAVRNHLSSIHAMALANLCELTSGLAMLTALPKGARGILTGFHVEYLKKARGTLTARSRVSGVDAVSPKAISVNVEAFDQSGACVTKAQADWKIGPAS